MVLNIIQTNRWKRPVYFAVTCSPDAKIGLEGFFRFCGLAWRLMPVRTSQGASGLDPRVLEANYLDDSAEFFKTQHYGYRFQSLADSTVYLDDNEARTVEVFRMGFRTLAQYFAESAGNPQKCGEVLDRMERVIPASRIPMTIEDELDNALLYQRIGRPDKFDELSAKIEARFASLTGRPASSDPYLYAAMLQLYEARKEYQKELSLLQTLALQYPKDPSLKQRIAMVQSMLGDTTARP